MQLNVASQTTARTHEGALAHPHLSNEGQLRRSVASCLLWESEFYEDGVAIADRIAATAEQCSPAFVANLAREARGDFNLRHVPLLLLAVLAKTGSGSNMVSDAIADTIQRADELTEFLAIYWRNGKCPLSAQVKKGLARAFRKFDVYHLAKYNRNNAVKLRDVLFLVHPKPKNGEQQEIWNKLTAGTLESPDTWEVNLSGGADKKDTWTRLLSEGQIGYLALLRNLRNMTDVGVDDALIRNAIIARKGAGRVLPFRYIAAARACPQLEPVLDQAISEAISEMPVLNGKTVVLVDVSRSMAWDRVSARSDMTRMDAAAALACIIHGDLRVFTFSQNVVEVPPRRGMAGVDAIVQSQHHGGTYLGAAVTAINEQVPHDRLIVVTDEQSHDRVTDPVCSKAYMINVASNQNGVGYGRWTHIDGFSEQLLRFVNEHERAGTS